jgi:hypothetical protein
MYGVGRLCHRVTDGFCIANIQSKQTPNPRWEISSDFPHEILKQKFHYSGKGAQSYVFVSEDGKFILKFFKFHHHRSPKKQQKLENLFEGYKIAFQELKEESGLLFVHLNKTSHLKTSITILDRLNIEHHLDADQTEFILQKRAELVLPTLKDFLEKRNLQGAKQALVSLVGLLQHLKQKGIEDFDPHLTKNFGFIEGKAVQIDCGNLVKTQNRVKTKEKGGSLKKWLAEESPELAESFQNLMQNLYD